MTARGHRLSYITDEIKAPLAAGIDFALAEGLGSIEIRMLGDANVLSLGPVAWREAAQAVKARGLEVACIASPLLKWTAPGRSSTNKGDQFAFDPAGRDLAGWAEHAAAAAHAFGTRNLRIFSYLAYDGYHPSHLAPAFDVLLPIAEREDLVLHVENEPVCNVRITEDLLALVRAFPHRRLRALLDVANMASLGHVATKAEVAAIMPWVDLVHFKDHSRAKGKIVALGEGDIDFAGLLETILAAAGDRALTLTIETHVPDDQPGATRRSLAHLRQLLARMS